MSDKSITTTGIDATALARIEARNAIIEAERAAMQALVVKTPDDAALAQTHVIDLKEFVSATDAERRTYTDPLRAQTKALDDAYRVPADAAKALLAIRIKSLSEYALAAQELQRKAFAAASKLLETGNNTEARAALAVNNSEARKVMPKGSSVREVWVPEIFDESLVERMYCQPNEKQIKALGKATSAKAKPPVIGGVQWVRRAEVRTGKRK